MPDQAEFEGAKMSAEAATPRIINAAMLMTSQRI
jgi:hypothetical protein